MGSGKSDTRLRASECSEALRNARSRIRQHLNNTAVAQCVVKQFEEHVQAAEAPGLAQFTEGRQKANVAFPGQLHQNNEPAVGLLKGDALIDAPVGDQLFERRDRDRVFGHPLHKASPQLFPCVPLVPPTCIAHVSAQFKLLPFDKRPLFVVAAQAQVLGRMAGAYSRAGGRTRAARAAARRRRTRQRIVGAADTLWGEGRPQP